MEHDDISKDINNNAKISNKKSSSNENNAKENSPKSETLPAKVWKAELKSIETSLMCNESDRAYSKAQDLFGTISASISDRWDLCFTVLGFSKRFFNVDSFHLVQSK